MYGSEWLWDLEEKSLSKVDLANLAHYDLVKIIGRQMAKYIMESKNDFMEDLVNENGNDQLVTFSGDVTRIRTQMKDPDWLDNFQG